MWYFADEDVTIPIEYVVEGEYIVPTAAVVSLRNNSGVLDDTIVNQTLDVTTTNTSLVISAAKNSVETDALFSNRYVKLTFTYRLKTYHKVIQYSVMDFVPMTGTPGDVRSQLGLDDVELQDKDIDLNRAYFDLLVQDSYELSTNLVSGTRTALVANEAIVLQAALNLVPSLRLRVAASLESEDSKFQRFGRMDFDEVEAKLRSRQTALLIEIDTSTQVEFDIFGVSIPTDPVTNA
jgi:hypothetical protein